MLSAWHRGTCNKWLFPLLPASLLPDLHKLARHLPKARSYLWIPGCLTSKQSKAPTLPSRAWCLGVACQGVQNAAQHPFPGLQSCSTLIHRPWGRTGGTWLAPQPALPPGRENGFFPKPPFHGTGHTPVTAPAVPSCPDCSGPHRSQSVCRDENWWVQGMSGGESSPSLGKATSTSRPESVPMFQPLIRSTVPPFRG